MMAAFVPATGAADNDARSWLQRMKAAATGTNYQGTLVFIAGGVISSSRVWHYRVGDNTFERLEAQDGRQQRIFRHNDEVRTVWPQSGTAVVERRETLAAWSTTPQAVDPSAADSYVVRQEGAARVAGRDAAVLVLTPRDDLRFAQRLWADQATGLMLRADVIAADGSLVESSAFSAVELGVKPQPESVLQAMRQDAGLRIVRPQQRRTTLASEGWVLARPVPGFALAGCVMLGLDAGAAEPSMLQVVFSDGLTHVSVFLEPFNAERHRSEMQAKLGATNTAMRRVGEHWLTMVGDVPPAALKQFAEALERRR
ncbi:MAG: MucB/RseB C-terminal domain-containing protein [Burkholderiales bacterium]|nr:MucB/RseB C-terminal domain-containing protein [Burkholderiales bacterium]